MKILKCHRSALLLALLCCLSIETQANTSQASPDLAAIDAYVSERMRDLHIPGAALGIVQGKQIVHLQLFGVADAAGRRINAQTPFRIGSITKSFTALAVMQLVEAGKIELDAPVQRYLPWFRVADEQASAQITVRHLLNQTSGFSTLAGNAYWNSQEALETIVRRLQTVALSQPVGARFQYSNINYSIAGLIVETVSGQRYADYIAQHIFAPLAMRHSYTTVAPALADGMAMGHLARMDRLVADIGVAPPVYQPAGFVTASIEDMTHYAVAQLNGGRYGDSAILSPQGMTQLHRPAVSIGDIPIGPKATFYGMGWVVGPTNGTPTVWHNGDTGRFHAILLMAPERSLGIVLLANVSGLEHLIGIDDIAKGVLSLLQGQAPATTSTTRILFRLFYWAILFAPELLLIGVARGAWRWRRGDFAGLAQQPHARRKQLWCILLMVLPNLAAVLFFLFGVPQISGLPLTAFRILYPDVAYALLAGIAIGIVWSGVYPALVLLPQCRQKAVA